MPTGLSARWLERLAALVAVWMIGDALGGQLLDDHLWVPLCFLAIMLVIEFLAFRHGMATGIVYYRNLTPTQRKEIEEIIDGGKQ